MWPTHLGAPATRLRALSQHQAKRTLPVVAPQMRTAHEDGPGARGTVAFRAWLGGVRDQKGTEIVAWTLVQERARQLWRLFEPKSEQKASNGHPKWGPGVCPSSCLHDIILQNKTVSAPLAGRARRLDGPDRKPKNNGKFASSCSAKLTIGLAGWLDGRGRGSGKPASVLR